MSIGMPQLRFNLAALVCSAGLLMTTVVPGFAQANTQNGLVNVNLQDLNLAIPVSVAVPVAVAADVCGISVLSAQTLTNCTASSNSAALSRAIADQMTGTGGGGGGAANNNQSGLVNVNVQDLNLAVPASVAVPIGVAANVCGVSVLSLQNATSCDATTTTRALSQAIARQLAG